VGSSEAQLERPRLLLPTNRVARCGASDDWGRVWDVMYFALSIASQAVSATCIATLSVCSPAATSG